MIMMLYRYVHVCVCFSFLVWCLMFGVCVFFSDQACFLDFFLVFFFQFFCHFFVFFIQLFFCGCDLFFYIM